ncbi:telomerase protein component 1-like isoform X1 [Clavelina lepadiformis]|uniref:telomerase protein component 1-like isoform X1 n=2 Tax=Clavelina lepadiformis TaxID=159417 RepID=UPI0040426ECC
MSAIVISESDLKNPLLEHFTPLQSSTLQQDCLYNFSPRKRVLDSVKTANYAVPVKKTKCPKLHSNTENTLLARNGAKLKNPFLSQSSKLSVSGKLGIDRKQLKNCNLTSTTSTLSISPNLFGTSPLSLSSKLLRTSSLLLLPSSTSSVQLCQNINSRSRSQSIHDESAQQVTLANTENVLKEVEIVINEKYNKTKLDFFNSGCNYKPEVLVTFPKINGYDQASDPHLTKIDQIKIELIDCVCSSLLNSPDFKKCSDPTHITIKELSKKIARVDPEFILKVALYTRQDLNIRTTANFLLALATYFVECRPYLKKYFNSCIQLPSDWIVVAEIYQSCFASGKKSVPAALRKVMTEKFKDFSHFQLAKYNKDSAKKARKKKVNALKNEMKRKQVSKSSSSGTDSESDSDSNEEVVAMETEVVPDEEEKVNQSVMSFTLKQLIRQLHITKPGYHVMCLIGKKYPSDMDSFYRSGLEGTWDAARSGTRMKLPVPETWETQVSARGNNAKVWEELLDHNALPFMAMLRNIRNLIKANISEKHHKQVLNKLRSEKAVARSRQFPVSFFSAYAVLDELEKDIEQQKLYKQKGVKALLSKGLQEVYKKRTYGSLQCSKSAEEKKIDTIRRQLHKKYDKPYQFDAVILQRYRKALNRAVELAASSNVAPIRGHTLLLCEASDSMSQPCNSAKSVGSKRTKMEVAILFGLMCAYACEKFTFIMYITSETYQIVELEKNGILENLNSLLKLSESLREMAFQESHTSDDSVPFQYLHKSLVDFIYYDNLVHLSSVMSHGGQSKMEDFLAKYRDQMNAKLMYFDINLSGGRSRLTMSESSSRNVKISGYSDQILRYIAEGGGRNQLSYVENIDRTKKLFVEDLDLPSLNAVPRIILHAKAALNVKVFISSTLKDMHGERDMLVRYVFPELRRRALPLNIEISECDLRWGVTTDHYQSVKVCLDEVKRSQLFVGLLGTRYGWVPKAADLPQDGEFAWIHDLPDKRSITELEMLQGALQNKSEMKERAFFYIRDGISLDQNIPKKFQDDFVETNSKNIKKLQNLKSLILKSGFPVYNNYPCKWGGKINNLPAVAGLDLLAEKILNDLWQGIKNYVVEHDPDETRDTDDKYQKAISMHKDSFKLHADSFVARQRLLDSTLQKLQSTEATRQGGKLFALVGEPGTGKTSFLSALAQQCGLRKHCVTLVHGVGNGAVLSNDLHFLLNGFSYQLSALVDTEESTLPLTLDEALSTFWNYVKLVTKRHQMTIYMFIDNLDALNESLQWIPEVLPSNVVLVASCLKGFSAHNVLALRKDTTILPCPLLGLRDKSAVVEKTLSKYGKTLDSKHFSNRLQTLVLKRESANPLYLATACQYLRYFASFASLGLTLSSLPQDLPNILQLWLNETEKYITSLGFPMLPSLALMIIYCSKTGIVEEELFKILKFWIAVFGEVKKDVNVLNRATFQHMLHLLSIFLSEVAYDGITKLTFAHSVHAEAICKRYKVGKMFECCNKMVATFHMNHLLSAQGFSTLMTSSLLNLPNYIAQANDNSTLLQLLSNFDFIEAKCRSGQTAHLVKDYLLIEPPAKAIKSGKDSKWDLHSSCQEFQSLLSSNLHILQEHPSFLSQFALNSSSEFSEIIRSKLELGSSALDGFYLMESLDENYSTVRSTQPSSLSNSSVTCVAVSPREETVACATRSRVIHIFDVQKSQTIHQLQAKAAVSILYFISRRILMSGHANGQIMIWDVTDGLCLFHLQQHMKIVTGVCLSKPHLSMVTVAHDKKLVLWKLSGNKQVHGVPIKVSFAQAIATDNVIPTCVEFHPTLMRVAVGLWDATIRIWDLATGKRVAVLRGSSSSVTSLKYSLCEAYIVSTSLHCDVVSIWSSESGNLVGNFGANGTNWMNTLDLIPKDDVVVAGGKGGSSQFDGIVKVWRSTLGKRNGTLSTSTSVGNALCCAFNGDCSMVAVGYHEKTLAVYNTSTMQLNFKGAIHSDAIRCLCWLEMTENESLKSYVVSGSDDCSLKVFQPGKSEGLATCKGHTGKILSVACTKSLIASASEDISIILWRFKGLPDEISPTMILRSHDASPTCLSFKRDSTCLASGGKDMKLIFWDIKKFKKDLTPCDVVANAHQDWITSCAWSDTSDHLVTGSNDCSLKIWSQQVVLYHITSLKDSVTSVAYSHGCIVSGTTSGLVHLWSHKGVAITTLNTGDNRRVNSCHLAVSPVEEEEEKLNFDDDEIEAVQSGLDWSAQVDYEQWQDKHEQNLPGQSLKTKKKGLSRVKWVKIVTAVDDELVTIWDPLQGEEMFSISGGGVISSLSSSNRTIAASSQDGSISIWQLPQDWSRIHRMGHEAEVTQMCSHEDLVMTGCAAGCLSMWKISDQSPHLTLLKNMKAHDLRISGMFVLNAASGLNHVTLVLCTSSYDETIKVWRISVKDSKFMISLLDTIQWKKVINFLSALSSSSFLIGDVDGDLTSVKWSDKVLSKTPFSERRPVTYRGHLRKPSTKEDNLSGHYLVDDLSFRHLGQSKFFPRKDNSFVWSAAIVTKLLSSGDQLVVGDGAGRISIPELDITLQIHDRRITSIIDANDVIVTSSLDRTIKVWEKSEMNQIGHYSSKSAITACLYVKSSRSLVCADVAGSVHIVRLRRFKL